MMTISGVGRVKQEPASPQGSWVRNIPSPDVRSQPQDLTALSVVENGIKTATD
jgi:hypothetical protein